MKVLLDENLDHVQLPIIQQNLTAIAAALGSATPGSFRIVECGVFSRKKSRAIRPADE
ncbi:MAG TPA: hypothetical protein VMB85_27635 [Bryobacteraceae bacterium]|nr:hypothetical protein [Bryobacteraceae bacterium]